MFKKIHELTRNYVMKDFVQDKFDGVYPFNLENTLNTKYKTFGEKNPDKFFFIIWRTPYEAGFFSNVRHVIGYLKLIEGTNFIPVVDFQNFKTFYNNEKPINGTENSWEYYFEQLSPYSLEEVYQSKNVLFCDGKYPYSAEYKFIGNELNEYYAKVFKIKENISNLLIPYEEIFSNNKVLGIHFRGKDLNIFPGHPFGPTEKQIFKYTDEIIEKYGTDKLFIATDEKRYLDEFIKRYGTRVFYANNFRTEKINEFNINPRENHRYLLGLEVIVDTILLSKCNGLLCGPSGVSWAAQSLTDNYQFIYRINNGVNVNNKYKARYLYSIKKRLPRQLGGLLDQVSIIVNTGEKHE